MKKEKIIFILSLIGLLFSGTLTFQKLFTGTCSLTEGCSYFLGYPTCYYGFVFFLALFILSGLLAFKKKPHKNLKKSIFYVSILATIFASIFSFKEIFFPNCIGECIYSLLIPSCVYGLAIYISILILSFKLKNG